MPMMAVAFPILPGKTAEWREFMDEVNGPRRDEFDASRVKLGSPVTISAEGFEPTWRGTIEEIPDSVISRRLKPQDPSKPIDTRVLLVKVALNEPAPLKLGQRVEVRISSR